MPAVSEAYARSLGPTVSRVLSRLTGIVPLSLAEAVIYGAAAWLLVAAARTPWRARRRGLSLLRSMARDASILAAAALVALLTFDLSWGVYYARPDLATRLGWRALPAPAAGGAPEVQALASRLVDATNADYEAVAGSRDLGRTTEAPPLPALDAALERAYAWLGGRLPLEPGIGAPRGRAKPFAASALLCRLGISGFYFPWTAEASYNRLAPSAGRPHVIAHEKAHQRGAASEDEAQFVGYMACAVSDDPYVRYSGHLFAQRELLFSLRAVDRAATEALLARRDPGVQRDVDAEIAFWNAYRGRAREVSQAVNDRYLRVQGVPGGIDSYRRATQLLLLYARATGDVLPSR